MSEAEDPALQSHKSQRSSPESFREQVRWICDKLLHASGTVSREDFVTYFLGDETSRTNVDNLKAAWSRAKNAVETVLASVDMIVQERDATLRLKTPLGLPQFATAHFQSDQDFEAKQCIGDLVAGFLADKELSGGMSVFLGSGSTVFHVGYKMCERGPYEQLFATVNIPVAALWCQRNRPPVEQVSIPEAVLETPRARLATIQKPSWTPAISIVGADGCHYEPDRDEVSFYAMNESVALNTNLFARNATDLVIVCLASGKMDFGRNMGPRIDLPRSRGVRRALVTDKRPIKVIADAIRAAGWTIITKDQDWRHLPERQQPLSPSAMIRAERSRAGAEGNILEFPTGEE